MLELLTNCRIYNPANLGLRHILIGGSTILWIGTKIPQLDGSLEVVVTNMDGLIVMPGLIDGHAHLTGGGGESGFSSRVPVMPLSAFTRAGVTTAIGVLGTDDVVRTTGSLVAQARSLCEQGMTAYCHTGGYHVPLTTLTGSVREDIVHIDRIIGVGELAISDHRSSQPTLDELLRIAADAHVAGMMTNKAGIVHLHLGDGVRGLEMVSQALDRAEIPARVYNPTHVNRRKPLFDQAVQLARRGCTIDVTCNPDRPNDDEWSAEQAILRYFDSDAPADKITASSDGGGCIPKFDVDGRICSMETGDPVYLLQCLQNLLNDGSDLERILPVFTRNVANLLRLTTKGRLAVDCDADLLIIDDTGQYWGTMALGVWQVKDGDLLRRGKFESV